MSEPIAAVSAELEMALSAYLRSNRVPGVAAGVVLSDKLAWSAGVGHADLASGRPTRASLLYDIASITKTFTGTAVMQLRDTGLLDLGLRPRLRKSKHPGAGSLHIDSAWIFVSRQCRRTKDGPAIPKPLYPRAASAQVVRGD